MVYWNRQRTTRKPPRFFEALSMTRARQADILLLSFKMAFLSPAVRIFLDMIDSFDSCFAPDADCIRPA